MIRQLGTFDVLAVRRIHVAPPASSPSFNVEFHKDSSHPRHHTPLRMDEEHDGLQYVKVYFDFAYYFLVCPYRFVWCPSSRTYKTYVNRLQKTLHYLFFFILCVCYLLRLRAMWATANTYSSPVGHLSDDSSPSSPHKQNPTEYFDIAVYFFDSTFMLFLFLYFGRRETHVHAVFNELQLHPRKLSASPNYFKRTRLQSTIILVGCTATVVLKLLEFLHDHNFSPRQFTAFKLRESRRMFLFPALIDALPGLFIFVNIAAMLYEKILNDFGDILFTLCALLFTNLVAEFSALMTHAETDVDKMEILEHYTWLRCVTGKINTAMQVMTGAFIAGNLPFFATTVLEVFGAGTENILVRARYMIACFYFFPSICIAANANKRVDRVKEWISVEDNYGRLPSTRLQVFLHDLHFHSVGLSAFGILTVNWNAVGSIISIILTYALLKTQFKATPEDSSCLCNCTFVTS